MGDVAQTHAVITVLDQAVGGRLENQRPWIRDDRRRTAGWVVDGLQVTSGRPEPSPAKVAAERHPRQPRERPAFLKYALDSLDKRR